MISLNVAGLLHEQPGTSRGYRLRDYYVTLGSGVELAGPLNGFLRLQRTNRSVFVRGEITAPLRRTCGRCTDPYVEQVAVTVEEEFLPSVDLTTGAALAERGDPEDAPRIDEHHEIDLGPVIHDELALSEPIMPLCSAGCPGLCAGCGRRLDTGSCTCAVSEPDERLAVLARLLDRPDQPA